MFKKIITSVLAVLLLSLTLNCLAETDDKPVITSTAYVLYNPENNEIIDSKNYDKQMYPASLTKMLTALTVLDLCQDLSNEKVTVSENAVNSLYGTGSSNAGIKIGEVFTVEQLLYLMLLPSGNDAANALSEHFSNSNKSFVEAMNEKAKAIGMQNSNFVNPHGLHDDAHYSTALDLAVLSDEFMSVSLLYDIVKCNEYTVPKTNLQQERIIYSTNLLKNPKAVYYYEYATGLKTGNTDKAGRCLAASAEKDGVTYICILLNTPMVWDRYGMVRTDFQEAKAVFEYAFKTYKTFKVANKEQKITEVFVYETDNKKVKLGLKDDVFATLPKNANVNEVIVDYKIDNLRPDGTAESPVKKGSGFGNAEIILNNKILGTTKLVALENVEPNGFLVFWHKIDFYVYLTLSFFGLIILTFVLLIVRKQVVIYKRKKAKEKRLERRKKMFEDFQNREPFDYFKFD